MQDSVIHVLWDVVRLSENVKNITSRAGECFYAFRKSSLILHGKPFVIPLIHVCLSGVKVRHIAWNPSFTDVIAILLMDGQVILVKLTGTVATVSASLQATATAGKV
jgi:hypothetical protein